MVESAFAEPWEARTFALVRILRDQGVFSAEEWTDALGTQLSRSTDDEVHYGHWLDALESLLDDKRVAGREALDQHRTAWRRAAGRTPHGQPITLATNDFPD